MARPPGIGRSVEGVHAVAAAVETGRVQQLFVESQRQSRSAVAAILTEARRQGVAVEIVESVLDRSQTDAPQGVVAIGKPIPVAKLDSLAAQPMPALLVLDHIEDPHNVGAIARSAMAAGITGLVASTRRSAPFGPTAFKAAAGALERLPVALVSSVPSALERLKRRNIWSVGLAMDGPESLFGLALLDQPVALVVGAEGRGLAQLTAERCDVLASIPMEAGESLNASVAAALASYEVMRARTAT